jgi:putative endonuclease
MASHNEAGKAGENLAAAYLEQHGYRILHRNWRHSYYEIDIVAIKDDLLRVIEVKTLKSSRFRNPEDSVTVKKFRDLKKAAEQFIFLNPQYRDLRFEILSVIMHSETNAEFFLIEDVFF